MVNVNNILLASVKPGVIPVDNPTVAKADTASYANRNGAIPGS